MKLFYYIKNFFYNQLPGRYFKQRYAQLQHRLTDAEKQKAEDRVNYYCRLKTPEQLSAETEMIKEFQFQKPSAYYFDLKQYLHYFQPSMKISYRFSDETTLVDQPTLIKARKINFDENAVVFKLDSLRHFQFVEDQIPYEKKSNMAVWRGVAHQPERRLLLSKFFNHPICDIGDTSDKEEWSHWQKGRLSKSEMLNNKIILCPQGYDVATSLKWVFSSNSLCVMPKPTRESWFMEGTLKAGVHYVQVKDDFSDLIEKVNYYCEHVKLAKEIISNANKYVRQFQNEILEEYTCIELIKKYGKMTCQPNVFRFKY